MATSPAKTGTTTKARKATPKGAVSEVVTAKSIETSVINFADVYRLAPTERIQIIKEGVPAGEVVKLAKTIGRSKERLFQVLGLPRATVDRKTRANQRLSVEQGERVVGFSRLVGQVQVMVEQSGDPRGFDPAKWVADWLDRPLPALGGRCPADYMDTSEGQELISSLLVKMQSGAYA
jgi:putative toxin-antitoxin system antitoxin component (TIGR02293 family)